MAIKQLLPEFVRERYIRKFTLIVLAIAVLVGGVGFVTQADVSDQVKDDRKQELKAIADQESAALNEWRNSQLERTALLSENSDFEDIGSQGELQSSLDNQVDQFPESLYALYYVEGVDWRGDAANDTEAEIVGSTVDAREGESLADAGMEWRGGFRFRGDNDAIESNVYADDGKKLIAYASPVENKDAAMVAVFDAAQRGEGLRDTVEGGYTQVVDSNGQIQFATNSSKTLSQYDAGTDVQEISDGTIGGDGIVERNGDVIAYAYVDGTDRVVVKHAPQSNAYALSRTVTERIGILIALVLLGFAVLGVIVSRGTISKLDGLASNARGLATGEVDQDIEDSGRIDEIGEVQDAFRETQAYMQTVAGQADAIAEQDFDAEVLQEDVPGDIGVALSEMRHDIEEFITELEEAKANARSSQEKAEELAAELNDQAEEFSDVMEDAASGDFTQRLDTGIDNDAMREIAEAFNAMLGQLEATVVEVRDIANEVDNVSDEISTGAEEVQNASQEVSESVQEIAAGAEQQNENIQQAADEMTDLSATVEEIASSSDEVAQQSREAADLGEEGSTYATEAVAEMNDIEQQAAETVREVERLDDEMEHIGEIVDLIDDIAEQTNMLALNASIEAARAGEAGEGFGVVADEIKGLAEETSQATQEIEDLITEVQASTAQAVGDMQEMGQRVEAGRETVEGAASTLEDIIEQVEKANAGVQSINDATDEQAASTEEVVAMVDEVGSISEQTSGEAEDVAAAAEEQTASMSEVTDSIVDLSSRAADLREITDQFEIREAGVDVDDLEASAGTGNVSTDDD